VLRVLVVIALIVIVVVAIRITAQLFPRIAALLIGPLMT
jgi:hypothetical protein